MTATAIVLSPARRYVLDDEEEDEDDADRGPDDDDEDDEDDEEEEAEETWQCRNQGDSVQALPENDRYSVRVRTGR